MRNYFFLIVATLFFSCTSKVNYQKPDDLIPKKQMINLLTDMHLVNGTSGVVNSVQKKKENYMSVIYEKYNIDSTRFAESNLYYISNINEYEKMFKKVEQRLKIIKEKYNQEKDSLIKLRNMKNLSVKPIKDVKRIDSVLK